MICAQRFVQVNSHAQLVRFNFENCRVTAVAGHTVFGGTFGGICILSLPCAPLKRVLKRRTSCGE